MFFLDFHQPLCKLQRSLYSPRVHFIITVIMSRQTRTGAGGTVTVSWPLPTQKTTCIVMVPDHHSYPPRPCLEFLLKIFNFLLLNCSWCFAVTITHTLTEIPTPLSGYASLRDNAKYFYHDKPFEGRNSTLNCFQNRFTQWKTKIDLMAHRIKIKTKNLMTT